MMSEAVDSGDALGGGYTRRSGFESRGSVVAQSKPRRGMAEADESRVGFDKGIWQAWEFIPEESKRSPGWIWGSGGQRWWKREEVAMADEPR